MQRGRSSTGSETGGYPERRRLCCSHFYEVQPRNLGKCGCLEWLTTLEVWVPTTMSAGLMAIPTISVTGLGSSWRTV